MLRPSAVDLAVEKLYRLFGFTVFLEHSTAKVEISFNLKEHLISINQLMAPIFILRSLK
jgi:hypothetical protein